MICGVLSALVIGYVLDKTSRYLLTMRFICFGSTILFIVGYASFATGNIYIVGANIILDGFALVPFLPVCIAYAAEVTFPMQEAVIVGILQMSGQITGLLFGFVGSLAFTIKQISDYHQT